MEAGRKGFEKTLFLFRGEISEDLVVELRRLNPENRIFLDQVVPKSPVVNRFQDHEASGDSGGCIAFGLHFLHDLLHHVWFDGSGQLVAKGLDPPPETGSVVSLSFVVNLRIAQVLLGEFSEGRLVFFEGAGDQCSEAAFRLQSLINRSGLGFWADFFANTFSFVPEVDPPDPRVEGDFTDAPIDSVFSGHVSLPE